MDVAVFGIGLKRQVAFYQKAMGERAKRRKHLVHSESSSPFLAGVCKLCGSVPSVLTVLAIISGNGEL